MRYLLTAGTVAAAEMCKVAVIKGSVVEISVFLSGSRTKLGAGNFTLATRVQLKYIFAAVK